MGKEGKKNYQNPSSGKRQRSPAVLGGERKMKLSSLEERLKPGGSLGKRKKARDAGCDLFTKG